MLASKRATVEAATIKCCVATSQRGESGSQQDASSVGKEYEVLLSTWRSVSFVQCCSVFESVVLSAAVMAVRHFDLEGGAHKVQHSPHSRQSHYGMGHDIPLPTAHLTSPHISPHLVSQSYHRRLASLNGTSSSAITRQPPSTSSRYTFTSHPDNSIT